MADARAIGWLLLSPRGWTGRVNFLRGMAAIFILNCTLTAIALRLLVPAAAVLVLPATLYLTVCVTAKRLHGLGLSAWLQTPVRLLMGAGVALLVLYQHHQGSDLIAGACGLTFVLGMLAETGMFIWLAAAPNRTVPAPPAEAPD